MVRFIKFHYSHLFRFITFIKLVSVVNIELVSISSKKPGYLKTLRGSNYHWVYLPAATKACVEILFILFWPRVINKHFFCECVETRSFFILANSFYGSWSSSKFSVFQAKYLVSQKQVFLKNKRAFSNILYGFFRYLIIPYFF